MSESRDQCIHALAAEPYRHDPGESCLSGALRCCWSVGQAFRARTLHSGLVDLRRGFCCWQGTGTSKGTHIAKPVTVMVLPQSW